MKSEVLSTSNLPTELAPSWSLETEKRTGSCVAGVAMLVVDHATLWDDPHATRVIRIPSRPCTSAGLWFTVVVPFACWP